MALILNIETATKNCSVSISKGKDILAVKEINEGKFSHAEKLHGFISEVVEEVGCTMRDINAIAISKGPGSYTGLRIGVSAAKGLCYALEIPLISISTLESMARQLEVGEGELIVPMLDARRMEVYSAIFNHNYEQTREIRAEIIDQDSYKDILEKGVVHFIGDGAQKCTELISHENAKFSADIFPSALQMAVVASQKYEEETYEDVAYFEPLYLKDFIAGKPKKYFR